MYTPSRKAAKLLGVHANTLRKWANGNKIKTIRNPAGQRLYDVQSFIKGQSEKSKICYCRVSSYKQRDDLNRQIEYMRIRYPYHEIIEDIGSGINFKRKGFNSLLERIMQGDVNEIIVAHKDRLCRFGFEFFCRIAEYYNTKVMVLNETSLSPQEELVQDLLSIIHVFSCRIHGLRSYGKKIKEDKSLSAKQTETK